MVVAIRRRPSSVVRGFERQTALARTPLAWYGETRDMRLPLLTLALGLAALIAGCGAARVISCTGTGGVLVLEGFRDLAKQDAHRQMTAHCRGPYTIIRETDEVAGRGTELRVRYVCGEIPGMPSSPYALPPTVLEGIPNANSIGLD